MQEAVAKLLQTSRTWCEGGEDLYHTDVHDSTHSLLRPQSSSWLLPRSFSWQLPQSFSWQLHQSFPRQLPQSFSWLSRSSAAVHPLVSSQSKPAVQHNRSLSSIGNKAVSSCKQSTAGRVTPAPRLDAASTVLSAQALSLFSKESSQRSLSQISLDLVSDSEAHLESDFHTLPLATRCLLQHPRGSVPLQHELEMQLGAFDTVLTGTGSQVLKDRRASQYESVETAASGSKAVHSSASSKEGCSLVVPQALVQSAVLLLRDNTLSAPQPKVSCHDVHAADNACLPLQSIQTPLYTSS